MVDSNLQRERVLPSEKAFAHKMELDAMKRQGQRTDLTSPPLAENVDCVEIDPYLRSILDYEFGGKREDEICERRKQLDDKEGWNAATRSRGELTPIETAEKRRLEMEYDWLHKLSASVIHDDFLTFQSRKRYDLIVMNPPFADGDAHLLKAIELQKRYGGQIRCLLNAETLLTPYTNRRKVL